MFCIKYKVDGQTGTWIDPNVRGNNQPMLFHDRDFANLECDMLVSQYNQEGFIFWVETYDLIPVET